MLLLCFRESSSLQLLESRGQSGKDQRGAVGKPFELLDRNRVDGKANFAYGLALFISGNSAGAITDLILGDAYSSRGAIRLSVTF